LERITRSPYPASAQPVFIFVPASTPRLVVCVIKTLADWHWPRIGLRSIRVGAFAAAAILGLTWAIFVATIG
jgi:hypothetical protein